VIWPRAVTLVNARVVTERGIAESVRFTHSILSVDERPKPGDAVIDARDAFVLPGLINAHDHLELNHYGRLKFRDRYGNASQWIEDMRPRLVEDPAIRDRQQHPLADRLFIGVLKNVLSGVTTVAHHNPLYRELRRSLPIRVLQRYGWAHSFFLQDRAAGAGGESGGDIRRRFRSTPGDAPFFVHLAEGTDMDARGELARLQAIGCLAPNTVLVHAVAIDGHGWRQVGRAGAGVVWCPASNNYLFGQTLDTARLRQSCGDRDSDRLKPSRSMNRVALGTDSRLTGSRDLLDELRIAYESSGVARGELLAMVTAAAADLIRQPRLGRLRPGSPADLIVVPRVAKEPIDALLATARRDLELVVAGGRPLIAGPSVAEIFNARRIRARTVEVDGVPKWTDPALARRITACSIAEPGVIAA
jgi:cytosine/adenosine deaminase-related metal-dependent hydrolase